MQKPTIGILTGMGPKSTAPFLKLLISEFEKTTQSKSDLDYPPILIYSLSTPFSKNKPFDPESIKTQLGNGLKRLEKCNVAFISIPCNTIHIYYETLKTYINIPLLNIVDATLKEIPPKTKKIAILGTKKLINSRLYQNALDLLGFQYIENSTVDDLVRKLIYKIKNESNLKTSINLYNQLSAKLIAQNIDLALNVCTDLNVVTNQVKSSFLIIDSSLCLAKETIKKWKEL